MGTIVFIILQKFFRNAYLGNITGYPPVFSHVMRFGQSRANENFWWIMINNYSPQCRWLGVDIYQAAKRRGKYSPLATDTEVNSCFSIY